MKTLLILIVLLSSAMCSHCFGLVPAGIMAIGMKSSSRHLRHGLQDLKLTLNSPDMVRACDHILHAAEKLSNTKHTVFAPELERFGLSLEAAAKYIAELKDVNLNHNHDVNVAHFVQLLIALESSCNRVLITAGAIILVLGIVLFLSIALLRAKRPPKTLDDVAEILIGPATLIIGILVCTVFGVLVNELIPFQFQGPYIIAGTAIVGIVGLIFARGTELGRRSTSTFLANNFSISNMIIATLIILILFLLTNRNKIEIGQDQFTSPTSKITGNDIARHDTDNTASVSPFEVFENCVDGIPKSIIYALPATAFTASSRWEYDNNWLPHYVVRGKGGSGWHTKDGSADSNSWLEVNFGSMHLVTDIEIEGLHHVMGVFEIHFKDDKGVHVLTGRDGNANFIGPASSVTLRYGRYFDMFNATSVKIVPRSRASGPHYCFKMDIIGFKWKVNDQRVLTLPGKPHA